MFVCLISPEPMNRFLNRFFFWKLRYICKFWIQNQFCAILGGWDIRETKRGSGRDKYTFILTWSGPHNTRVALRCPDWFLTGLRGPKGPQVAPTGLPRGVRATQGTVRISQGHSGDVRTTSGQYEYVLVYSRTPYCFPNISAPQNRTKLVLYSKFTYVSQFSEEKNGLEICSLVPEIFNKQTFERFF